MKDINVISINTVTGKITIDFKAGKEMATGRAALVQMVALSLLNDRGSDAFNPNVGSTIYQITGKGYSKNEADVVKTLLTLAIKELEENILQEQRGLSRDDPDTLLKSLDVYSIKYDEGGPGWDIKIFVKTLDNNIEIIGL